MRRPSHDADDAVEVAGDGGTSRFTLRRTDDGLLVVADVRGMLRDDVETEVVLGEESLVLSLGDRLSWWVPVDEVPTSITDVSLSNDVLSVRVAVE